MTSKECRRTFLRSNEKYKNPPGIVFIPAGSTKNQYYKITNNKGSAKKGVFVKLGDIRKENHHATTTKQQQQTNEMDQKNERRHHSLLLQHHPTSSKRTIP